MARLNKIPEMYHAEIISLSLGGKTATKIVEEMNAKYNQQWYVYSINRILSHARNERKEIARDILTEEIEASAARDSRILNKLINKLDKKFDQVEAAASKSANKSSDEMLKISAELRNLLDRSAKMNGFDAINDNSNDYIEAKEEIIEQLEIIEKKTIEQDSPSGSLRSSAKHSN